MKKPSLAEVKYIAHRLAQDLMTHSEPIPPFDSRYPGILESCLKTPFQTFNRKSLYPTFETKAAVLFYLMVKNHPFENGNKRVGVVTLYYFLMENGREWDVDNHTLYEFANEVASSEAINKDAEIVKIRAFIVAHTHRIQS